MYRCSIIMYFCCFQSKSKAKNSKTDQLKNNLKDTYKLLKKRIIVNVPEEGSVDLQFFKSLIPHVPRLPAITKFQSSASSSPLIKANPTYILLRLLHHLCLLTFANSSLLQLGVINTQLTKTAHVTLYEVGYKVSFIHWR